MYYNLRGLVLHERISSEADKLVRLYTREWGKISALVPGAKKISAKLAAGTEPVMESDFIVYLSHEQGRPKVTGVRINNGFAGLRTDWRRFVIAQCCAEISEVLTPFNSENEQKYDLLVRTWQLLEDARHPWRIFIAFTLRFLRLSGYSFVEYLRQEQSPVPERERKIIGQMATLSGADVDRCLDMDEETELAIRGHVDNYLNLYLPRPLATRKFWQKIYLANSIQRSQ